jgi:biotin transporter BioY
MFFTLYVCLTSFLLILLLALSFPVSPEGRRSYNFVRGFGFLVAFAVMVCAWGAAVENHRAEAQRTIDRTLRP